MVKIKRPQAIVYWAPAGVNEYGNTVFDDPVELMARWEYRSEIFTNAQGQEEKCSAIAYPDLEVKVRGYLAPVTLISLDSITENDPRGLDDAKEIKAVEKTPSIKGDRFFIEVFL